MQPFKLKGLQFIWAQCHCGIVAPAPLMGHTQFGCPYCMGQGNPRNVYLILKNDPQPATEWDELDPDDN